ncbi:hypothetical protein SAMN05660324_1388 [Klenkia brasiliensis]|uniref:Uncharacterized protein n=1 Tax=Klenkia brasiliensis TaxID=333142 RepID=A0A1G7Q977_9ACTN|nr:hypothetical protein SAMN05660324_1388 [Klenkia brasiliensis]
MCPTTATRSWSCSRLVPLRLVGRRGAHGPGGPYRWPGPDLGNRRRRPPSCPRGRLGATGPTGPNNQASVADTVDSCPVAPPRAPLDPAAGRACGTCSRSQLRAAPAPTRPQPRYRRTVTASSPSPTPHGWPAPTPTGPDGWPPSCSASRQHRPSHCMPFAQPCASGEGRHRSKRHRTGPGSQLWPTGLHAFTTVTVLVSMLMTLVLAQNIASCPQVAVADTDGPSEARATPLLEKDRRQTSSLWRAGDREMCPPSTARRQPSCVRPRRNVNSASATAYRRPQPGLDISEAQSAHCAPVLSACTTF